MTFQTTFCLRLPPRASRLAYIRTMALMLCAGAVAHANADVSCTSSSTQAGLNECAQQSFEAATARYAAAYRTLESAATSRQKIKLLKTQKAWLVYRTAACDLESSGVEGGSVRPMLNLQCAARMTDSRTTELARLVDCQQGDLGCTGFGK